MKDFFKDMQAKKDCEKSSGKDVKNEYERITCIYRKYNS